MDKEIKCERPREICKRWKVDGWGRYQKMAGRRVSVSGSIDRRIVRNCDKI